MYCNIIKIFIFILNISIFFGTIDNSYSYSNQLALKFGTGASFTTFNNSYAKDGTYSIGINSHFGYRFTDLELNLSSYVNIGRANLEFQSTDRKVDGSGTLQTSSFGPIIKYFLPLNPVNLVIPYLHKESADWRIYLGTGPTWAQQTLKLTEFNAVEGEYSANYKINYTSQGFVLLAGIEQMSISKAKHPAYIEVCYNFLKAKRVTVVKASDDFLEVDTISEEELSNNVTTHIFMVSIGFTAF